MEFGLYQPDNKSNPNPNPNPTTTQHAAMNIRLNIVTCPTYPDKFVRDNVVASFVDYYVAIVALPICIKQQNTSGTSLPFVNTIAQ